MSDPTVPLTLVLAKLKSVHPALFAEYSKALQAYADPEYRGVLTVPPSHVLIAQGRAQVVHQLLEIIGTCTEKAAKYQLQMKQREQGV